jgi:hypothetical protein
LHLPDDQGGKSFHANLLAITAAPCFGYLSFAGVLQVFCTFE